MSALSVDNVLSMLRERGPLARTDRFLNEHGESCVVETRFYPEDEARLPFSFTATRLGIMSPLFRLTPLELMMIAGNLASMLDRAYPPGRVHTSHELMLGKCGHCSQDELRFPCRTKKSI